MPQIATLESNCKKPSDTVVDTQLILSITHIFLAININWLSGKTDRLFVSHINNEASKTKK